MEEEKNEQQKGLFTFYKQLQAQEESKRRLLKKRKKGKSKKHKKQLKNSDQDVSVSPVHLKNISLTQISQSKQISNYSKFLRNVISKQNSQLTLSRHQQTPSTVCLKTDHVEKTIIGKQVINLSVQRKLGTPQISLSSIFQVRQTKDKNVQIDKTNYRIVSLHSKIQPLQRNNNPQSVPNVRQDPRTIKDEKMSSRSFLQKLKYLQQRNSSTVISKRESTIAQDKVPKDLHSQNKKYFQQLISNFYKRTAQKTQTPPQMIKENFKFPHITKSDKTQRIKTEKESPIQAKQKIESIIRRQINSKSSNQRYADSESKNQSPVVSIQEDNLLNLIDLSKDYTKQMIESEQRKKTKRMVRLKLGLQL